MKSKITTITISVAALIFVALLFAHSGIGVSTARGATTTQTEYKVIKLPSRFGPGTEEQLNALGAQGWEISYGFGEQVILKRIK